MGLSIRDAAGTAGKVRRGLVLEGGGPVGAAWMAGLAAGVGRHGVPLADADVVVGTSAGAIVGAVLTTGQDLGSLRKLPDDGSNSGNEQWNPHRLGQIRAILADPALDDIAARRALGRLALEASTEAEQSHLDRMAAVIGTAEWPDRDLRITTVDVETGEPRPWVRSDGISLVRAVAASTSLPGIYPPITINGHHYFDGGLRTGSNIHLVDGVDVLIAVEPTGNMFGGSDQSSPAKSASTTIIRIGPDDATQQLFRSGLQARGELNLPLVWTAAYDAGLEQAAHAVTTLDAWTRHG